MLSTNRKNNRLNSLPVVSFGILPGILLAFVTLAAGCGGRSVSGINNNTNLPDSSVTNPDGTVGPDGSSQPDGSVTCEFDDNWELTMTPLEGITVLTPQTGNGIPRGVTVRIEVLVGYTGCDEIAGVQAEVHPHDRTVLLYGYVWNYTGDRVCPHEAQQGREYYALHNLGAGEWHAVDYLINQPGIPFNVRECSMGEDCQCDVWSGIPGDWGATCQYDCMCQDLLGCVYDGSSDGQPSCFQTCSVTSDCPIPLFCNYSIPQESQAVCMSTGLLDSCQTDNDCPPGHQCLPVQGENYNWCRPTMATQPVGRPCDIDCDCPVGFSCVTMDPGGNPACQIRCRGNLDCPAGMFCDPENNPAGPSANRLVCNFMSNQ